MLAKALKLGVYIMALGYAAAGLYHFINPAPYLEIMPSWLPWHKELVFLSGAVEILLSLIILYKPWRPLAAWGFIILLVAIFPANIQMAINYYKNDHPRFLGSLLRLPIQFLLIWWAFAYTKDEP